MDGSIVDPNQKALKVDLSLGRLGKSVTGRSPGPSLRLGYPYLWPALQRDPRFRPFQQ